MSDLTLGNVLTPPPPTPKHMILLSVEIKKQKKQEKKATFEFLINEILYILKSDLQFGWSVHKTSLISK